MHISTIIKGYFARTVGNIFLKEMFVYEKLKQIHACL